MTRLTAPEALPESVEMCRAFFFFGKSDQAAIANVMFKGHQIRCLQRGTKYRLTCTYIQARTDTQISHTYTQTFTHTHIHAATRTPHTRTAPLRYLPRVLTGSRDFHCPIQLNSETTTEGTVVRQLTGKGNPVELDSCPGFFR